MIEERTTRRVGVLGGTVVSLALTLGACGGEEAPAATAAATTEVAASPATPAPEAAPAVQRPTVSLDEAQTAKAAELPGLLRNGSFPRSEVSKANARVFLYLAATSDDTAVQLASLRAMGRTYTHSERYTERLELITEEFPTVVLAHLGSSDGAVQAAAIEASKKCILGDTPNAEVTARLVQLASSHATAAGRHEAMDLLWNSSTIRDDPDQMAPYIAALDAGEAWVVSGALFRLESFGRAAPDQPAFRAKLTSLLTHADAGVRGRAARALANAVGSRDAGRDAAAQAIMPLLEDANPYTKSAACGALATLDYRPGIHAIMPLLTDMTSNTYDITGWQELAGSNGRIHHDGSAWSRVSDAALTALRTYSGRVGERFQYSVNHQQVEADLATAAATARTWYQAIEGDIPRG